MEIAPNSLKLGPVLPYENNSIAEFELRNPMEQAIEVYSLDFDKQYIEEEEILKRIESFNAATPEPIYLPLREPGNEFWSSLRKVDEKKRKMEELRKRVKAIEEQLQTL